MICTMPENKNTTKYYEFKHGAMYGVTREDKIRAIQKDIDILTRLNERLKVRFG